MKSLLSAMLLFVLAMPSIAFGGDIITKDDLLTRDGIYYKRFSNTPYTGKVTGIWQGNIVNGLIEGQWSVFLHSGELAFTRFMVRGKTHGQEVGYNVNGTRSWETDSRHGVIIKHKEYNGIGQLESVTNYKDGNFHGERIEYNTKDGSIKCISMYHKNKKVKSARIDIEPCN